MPCYNEASRWRIDYWQDILSIPNIDFLFVDDGSSDDTFSILKDYLAIHVSRLKLPINRGKAEAIREGFLYNHSVGDPTNYSHIGFMDTDGAIAKDDILAIWSFISKDSRN